MGRPLRPPADPRRTIVEIIAALDAASVHYPGDLPTMRRTIVDAALRLRTVLRDVSPPVPETLPTPTHRGAR